MKTTKLLIQAALIATFTLTVTAQQVAAPKSVTAFRTSASSTARSGELSAPSHVLVRGNKIERISTEPIPTDRRADTVLIDGGGRTLMPGLIDMHWHTMLVRPTPAELLTGDVGYLNLVAGDEATDTLMRGFTTVRDLGGPSFGLKRAIDEGLVAGPRIYPSGAVITVTSGHGDFRQAFELPRTLGAPQSRQEQIGAAMVADSPDEVRVRVREQLMQGASQIKLTAGGGVASPHSPLDASTFTEPELRAAVEAAENWGTYVTVHAYTPDSIQRSIAAGVKCIEHGHLMDEATAKLMAEKGIWLSMQPFPDELADAFPPGSQERAKAMEVFAGTDKPTRSRRNTRSRRPGGPTSCSPRAGAASGGNCWRSWSSGTRRPKRSSWRPGPTPSCWRCPGSATPIPGKLGVVEEGALADLLLVDGDPIENIKLIEDPDKNFVVIMKDGKVYKNLSTRADRTHQRGDTRYRECTMPSDRRRR